MNKDKMELEEAIKTLKIVANKLDQPFKFAIETVLQELENLKEEYRQYREIICVTGGKDIDDITATQYVIIQREGYLRGRKEEQEKAREYILELQKNSIPKKVIEDELKKCEKSYSENLSFTGMSVILKMKKLLEEK